LVLQGEALVWPRRANSKIYAAAMSQSGGLRLTPAHKPWESEVEFYAN